MSQGDRSATKLQINDSNVLPAVKPKLPLPASMLADNWKNRKMEKLSVQRN
jgi:hypothetical protein